MAVLEELGAAVKSAAEKVGPAVVGLGRGWGRGSGVVIADGLVLTNAHNLRGDDVTVTFADGRREAGKVAASDPDGDVAVIRVVTGDAPAIVWETDTETDTSVGTPVFALANPGGRGLRSTVGFVSAAGRTFRAGRGRRVGGAIEHTAPLPSGSSGGPLTDAEGRLIGINSVRLDGGLILALPADAALKSKVDALAAGDAPERKRLGVAIAPPHVARKLRRSVGLPERDGLLVRGVEDDSPAAKAGLERGDLIVAADGSPAAWIDDVHTALDGASGSLQLTVVRGTDEREVTVEL